MRLRAYDNVAKVKMQIYDNLDKTLVELMFKSFVRLYLEIKSDEEEFELYDPDSLTLKVIKYVEGERYDFKNLDSLPTQTIIVNKAKETVAELENKLSEMFGIPSDRIAIILKHNSHNNTIKPEVYNMAWRKPKAIADASKLEHGTILFIEEGDLKEKLENF